MKPPAHGPWYGLCFEVVIQRGAVPPYFITAEFNHSRTQHNAKYKPPEQNNNGHGWRSFWKWASIRKRAKKDSEKTSLVQLNLPAIAIPFLPCMNKRHVENPENSNHWRICVAGNYNQRKQEACPCCR